MFRVGRLERGLQELASSDAHFHLHDVVVSMVVFNLGPGPFWDSPPGSLGAGEQI